MSPREPEPQAPLFDLTRFAASTRVLSAALREALAGSDGGAFDGNRLDRRDPALITAAQPLLDAFCAHYLRLRVHGREHITAAASRGPVLYVANHNGGMVGPDIFATLGTLWSTRGPEAPLYALAHDFAMRQLAPFGRFIQRFGAVRAAPDNAARALAAGASVLVYPGGDLDAYRHFRRRDEIVFGSRLGFIRLAQRAGVPVVPVVAHGAHRSAVIVAEGKRLARWLRAREWARVERMPVALSLPWGVAVGPWWPYLPLPLPVTLAFLPPMHLAHAEPAEAAQDRVRVAMQRAMDALARGEAPAAGTAATAEPRAASAEALS